MWLHIPYNVSAVIYIQPLLSSCITVFASSFLYHDMSGFLDNGLRGNTDDNSTLLGPVLSSFLHSSGMSLLFTRISPPVRVTFPYPDSDTMEPLCVFWRFGTK